MRSPALSCPANGINAHNTDIPFFHRELDYAYRLADPCIRPLSEKPQAALCSNREQP